MTDRVFKPEPYIGVTGINDHNQAVDMGHLANQFKFKIMAGVTCSNKRLMDPTSSGSTSPALKDYPSIFMPMASCLRMLHYFTDNTDNLVDELTHVFRNWCWGYGGNRIFKPFCQAVQINQAWPDPAKLNLLSETNSDEANPLTVVLQLPSTALAEPIEDIVNKAKVYNCDYMLIDPSGGNGLDADLEKGSELLIALDEALEGTTIGIAGGFSADNVEERLDKISSIVKRPFCIDAQGKLRTNNQLDMSKVKAYLERASRKVTT